MHAQLKERVMTLKPAELEDAIVWQSAGGPPRHQFYDHFLAPIGLRTTQFSILAKLSRIGPMSINALASDLVMDRTTSGATSCLAA